MSDEVSKILGSEQFVYVCYMCREPLPIERLIAMDYPFTPQACHRCSNMARGTIKVLINAVNCYGEQHWGSEPWLAC